MSEEKKFTEEEITRLRDIRKIFQQSIVEIGQIEVQLIETKDLLENLNKRKIELLNNYNNLKNKEADFSKKLTEKYGVGTVDISSGTFSPA